MLKVARGLLAFSWNNKVAKRPSVKPRSGVPPPGLYIALDDFD